MPTPLAARSSTARCGRARRRGAARRRARGGCGRVTSVVVDLVAGGAEHVPLRTELVEPLAGGVARVLVADVAVERVAVVGHDLAALAGGRHAELPGKRTGVRGRWLRACLERGPDALAAAVAVAHVALVGLEEVERPAACVHEVGAVLALAGTDGGWGSGGGGAGRGGRGRAAIGVAAAARDYHGDGENSEGYEDASFHCASSLDGGGGAGRQSLASLAGDCHAVMYAPSRSAVRGLIGDLWEPGRSAGRARRRAGSAEQRQAPAPRQRVHPAL